jgi:hypothetical protein
MVPRGVGLVAVCAPMLLGCTSVLGDFSLSNQGSDAGESSDGNTPDGNGPMPGDGGTDSSLGDGGRDAGDAATDSGAVDAPADAPIEAGPPPVAGKAGTDLTAGGILSTSANYQLIGALGESPGGVTSLSTSTHYVLQGGVIAGTQK